MCCTVGKCCFCVNLRAGVISIACIWLLGDALFLAGTSFVTYLFNRDVQNAIKERSWSIILLGPFWMVVVYDALYSVAILLDIMLLVGSITGRRMLLNCWMAGYAVLYLVILLVCGISLAALAFFFPPKYSISFTVGLLVHAGLMVYFWHVVRSYYLELGEQQSEGTPIPTAGKVYNTVPMGNVPPAQDTYSEEGGFAMLPTAPPPYTSTPDQPPCYSDTTSLGIMR